MQQTLTFPPVELEVKEKFLVYAEVEYSRSYYETNNDEPFGWGQPPKQESKFETIVVGVVDNEADVNNILFKANDIDSKYQWKVVKRKLYAKKVNHYIAKK